MKTSLRGRHLRSSLSLAILLLLTLGRPLPAAAAPGDLIADVTVPEPDGTDKAVARDGQFLYYAERGGTVLHRIDVPPPGASDATGHIDIPIVGAPEGLMTIAYDAGRDMFWAVSSDGTTIYLVSKTGSATPQFTIDTVNGLPGNCKYGGCSSEVKIAYDRSDTIWYSPDTTLRVYHFQTTGDAQGHGVLVASSPYVDVDIAPNDFSPQCPYSYVSGIATGGSDLFFENSSCPYYFEYSKSGVKVAAIPISVTPSGGLTCDNLSYGASVIWMREGWTSHIYALEQPYANACVYGG
jgi:hypothetical protein